MPLLSALPTPDPQAWAMLLAGLAMVLTARALPSRRRG